MSKKRKKPKIEFRYYKLPAGSPVLALLGQKWVQNYGRDVDYLHFHNYLEIGYCYEGEGSITLGKEEVRFHGGDFTVIPKNYPHTTLSDIGNISRWEYLFIDVDEVLKNIQDNPMRLERIVQRVNSRALFLKQEEIPGMAAKILGILDIMRQMDEFYQEEARGILVALLAEIARYNCGDNEERLDGNESSKITGIVSRALDYISTHYMEEIRVEDLARYCHISETHFRRVFSSYMNASPLDYINTVRIQAACEHLKKSDDSIADIAHKCGFTTNSTFNRNFRQVTGTTPAEWRKRPENYERQLLNFDIHTEEGW